MKKAGRNDPCPCGSGKKYKKCCEATHTPGRLSAARITSISAPPIQKVVALSSLFQTHLAFTPRKPEPPVQLPLEENGNLLITS